MMSVITMRTPHRLPLAAFFLFITIVSVAAAPAGARFYTGAPEDILAQLPPPPAADSPAGQADIETLLQVQKDRTPAQVARAEAVSAQDGLSPGRCVFGAGFTAKNLPRTAAVLQQAYEERHTVVAAAKKKWQRPRPHTRGLGIRPCVEVPDNDSYPSGHSAARALWAAFYCEALPEYAVLFQDDVREAMWCRVLGGAHYPTDTQAGRLAGALIAREMLKNASTQDAIREMRVEILAFLKTHPEARIRASGLLFENQRETDLINTTAGKGAL
jgi:acid phosphatase (class A)